MILYDLEDSEKNPVYGKLPADNLSHDTIGAGPLPAARDS